jgi:hypothetical protein
LQKNTVKIQWIAEQFGIYATFCVTSSGLPQVNPKFMIRRHLLLIVIGVSFGITAPCSKTMSLIEQSLLSTYGKTRPA